MKTAWLRFFAELNDFLPPHRRQEWLAHAFAGRTSVKGAIEGQGVPHTEIELVLVNGQSADFQQLLDDGDRVTVYPVFEAIDIQPLIRVRPAPLRVVRFVLDAHLGRLAAYLRLAGFDTAYRNDVGDDELARVSADEHRILLTRDQALLKRRSITHGYWVRATDPRRQLIEVVGRFDLARRVDPFTRCARCNLPLQRMSAENAVDRVPPRVRGVFEEFRTCPSCERVYWKGSHHARILKVLEQVLAEVRGDLLP